MTDMKIIMEKAIELLLESLTDVYNKLAAEESEKNEENEENVQTNAAGQVTFDIPECGKEKPKRFKPKKTRKELLKAIDLYEKNDTYLVAGMESYKKLAKSIGCAENTIIKNLRRMVKAGEIRKLYTERGNVICGYFKLTKKGRKAIK